MAETPDSDSKLPRNVKVLSLASLVNDIASEMIFPLLPGFLLTALGGNKLFLGLIEGLADSVASVLKLWSGAWSDRAGRRKTFVVFGYSVAALARPLIGIANAPWQLLVIRLSDRIGKGIRTSPRDALIADSCDPQIRGRAFGFHRAMDHAGAAIGPLLAVAFLWLWPDQMRTMFTLTLVPGLLVTAVVIFGLRETSPLPSGGEGLGVRGRDGSDGSQAPEAGDRSAPHPSPLPKGEGARQPHRLTLAPFDRNFRLYLVALFVFTLGNSSDAFLLVRAGELGVPEFALPLLWCAFHVLKSSGNVVCGKAVDKFGPRPFLFVGWGVYAAVYLAFAFSTTAWQAAAVFLAYALFYGLTEPAEKTLVANLVGPERQGMAYGWYNFAIGVGTLPSSLIFGAIYQTYGALAAFGTGAGLAMLAAMLLTSVRKSS
jgi:MFS family permease